MRVEFERCIALAGVLNKSRLMDAVRNPFLRGGLDLRRRFPSAGVHVDVEAVVARALAIDAGLEDRLQMPFDDLGAGGEGSDFTAPRSYLPIDEGLDVGMIMSTTTIFAARRVVPPDLMAPAARSPIFKKDIRPDERPPPESFSFPAAQSREVGAGAGAVFEQGWRLAHLGKASMIPPSLTRSSATD